MRVFLGIGLAACAMVAGAAKPGPEPVIFPANARVVLDEHGVPQQVQANEKLPLPMKVEFGIGNDIGPLASQQEQEAAQRSPECAAALGTAADSQLTVVLDSPFKPLETG